jgi:hypothetical protein
MMLGREADPAGIAEVGPHIATRNLPQIVDHIPQPPIRAVQEQHSVPLLLQRHNSVYIAAGNGEGSVDVAQPYKMVAGSPFGGSQGEYFEGTQNCAGFTHLRGFQPTDTEATAHVRIEHTFPSQSQKCLADWGTADPELAGKCGVPNPGAGREFPLLYPVKDFLVHLVTKRLTGYQIRAHV